MIKILSHGDTALATNELVSNQPIRVRGMGGGGKGGGKASNDRNTLRSRARFNLIEAISEGPIWGLVDGERSIYFDQTPLLNADGSYNFKEVSWSQHKGLADEGFFNGRNAVETPANVEVQVKASTGPVVRTIVDENADAVRVITRIPSLVRQDDNGSLKATSLSYAIDVRAYNGLWQEAIVHELTNEKSLSPSQVAHRVSLPAGGSPWDLRVRRITPDSNDDKLQNDLYWEGYIVLVEGKFIYPHTAAIAMEGNAEEMGSNIPPRSYHVRGLLVKVPANYDPISRTYSGIWDGSWKIAWTNNPAWVFYDLLINDRYGLGEFIKPEIVDKWSLYTIAQYCDQPVKSGYKNGDTGADIWEPRFTFNGVINTKDEAFFVLQSITKAWRGMGYWAMGQVFATADMPSDPVRLVSPANVIGGDFEYAGTADKARHSVVMVKWNNPDDFYRADTEVVIDTDLLHKKGWRDKTLQLTGCTSRGLAHRYGKWVIDTEQHETDTLTYSASWDHAELRPGEIIAVSDPRKAQIRAAGRVVSHNGLVIELDGDFDWNEGETYQLMLTLPDGKLETRPILAFLDDRTVRVSTAFTQKADADAMWTIKGSDITPRLYRVLSVDETEPNIFKVTALFHDPQKFARVEEGISFEPLPYERPPAAAVPPSNLIVRETGYISGGQNYHSLTVSWTAPLNFLTRGFIMSVDTPDGESFTVGTTAESFMELLTTSGGTYKFYVQSIGYTGLISEPATIEFEAAGPEGFPKPTVSDLELVDNPGSHTFVGTDVRVRWKNNFALQAAGPLENVSSPHYSHNHVYVYHNGTGELLRSERITGQSYLYDFQSNKTDCERLGHSSPTRSVRIDVTVSDVFGRTSDPASAIFTNPVPAAIAPSYQVAGSSIYLGYTQPDDPDFAGIIILRSKTPGIQITDQPLYDGMANPLTIPGEPDTGYYLRIAGYDSFGKTDLNWSTEFTITTLNDGADVDPPETPTGLSVTSALVDGRARVTVSWNENTEEDLAGYDLQVKQGNGNWVSIPVVAGPYEFNGISGVQYQIRIRARDKASNGSAYTDPVVHVAIKDTTPPGKVTDVELTAGLTSFWLAWKNPLDADLAYIEVLENETNDAATAAVIARVAGSSFARTGLPNEVSRFYWLRAVDASENVGELSDVATATTAVLPDAKRVQIVGLKLTPNNPATNKVSWTQFEITFGVPGRTPVTKVVQAGNATWTAGTLYLYYVEGETTLRTSTSVSPIFVQSGHPIAFYRGGADVQLTDGKATLNGSDILAGTVGAQQLVANDVIITNTLQLKDAIITSAKIVSVKADQIEANGILAGTIQVGGDTLNAIRERANDPASRINQGVTVIEPGLILIDGDTTLSDWRSGGDRAKINGGAVAANSLAANTAVIGMRGINIDGITFEHNSPSTNRVSWTAGTIAWENDAGDDVTVSIAAGNALWTAGTLWLYWVQGETQIRATATFATANASNNVVLGSYKGGIFLFASYGRTVIDGGQLKTQSITTAQLAAGSVTAQTMSVQTLSSITSNIGVMVSGMLRSDDSLMQVDLNNRRILIADNT
ncbi:Phage-related protein, tail component [Rhizobium sp. AN5]|uniref:TipJ family phage tail tip protein n=1 Tax=Rhizobium sp. AN5 TaxID=1855304 RepID=UPI000BCA9CC1|nr:phage tail protein [Rhizobium sp. AN5]SOC89989.1 Phage-related protein, tail component [Rhizobium sp. AN5]